MGALRTHSGIAAPLLRADVDTDQIIPKQFLKRVERTGYGAFLFWNWRRDDDGQPKPGFVLDDDRYRGASVLVAGENFGCGSSREHAAWALREAGFRVVIAPSFADIFRQNADSSGIAAIEIDAGTVTEIGRRAEAEAPLEVTVDIAAGTVSVDGEVVAGFGMDDFRRMCLIEGLDRIGLTLRHEEEIAAYEARRWSDLR